MPTTQALRAVAIPLAIFAVGLGAAAITDVRSRRIPNFIVAPLILAGLVYSGVVGGMRGALVSLGGFAIGIAILFVPFVARLIGAGDVKLLGAVGAWLGVTGVFFAALLSAALTSFLVLVLVLRDSGLRKQVVTNMKTMFFFQEVVAVQDRPRSQTLPIGAAIAAASLWVALVDGRFPGV